MSGRADDPLKRLKAGELVTGESTALSRTDFVRYAGASGDLNPMHHDEVKAREAGFPSVFGHGMLSMGVLSTALADLCGLEHVRGLSVRFTDQIWPGDVLTPSFKRTDASSPQLDPEALDIAVSLENEDGRVVVSGRAQVGRSDAQSSTERSGA